MNLQTYDQIFDSNLRIKVMALCMWRPCICIVSRPLYVSVRYLENASIWIICLWHWLFYVFIFCLVWPGAWSREVHKSNDQALRNDFRPRFFVGMQKWKMNLQTYDQIHTLELVISLWSFVCGSHAFAMFPAHALREWQLHGGVRYLESSFAHVS